MSIKKLSQLDAASAIAATDLFLLSDATASKKVTGAQLRGHASSRADIRDFSGDIQAALNAVFNDAEIDTLYFPIGVWDVEDTLVIPGRGIRVEGESFHNLSRTELVWHGSTGSLLRGYASEMDYGGVWWGGISVKGMAFRQSPDSLSTDPLIDIEGMIYADWELCRFYCAGGKASATLRLGPMSIGNLFHFCNFRGADDHDGLYLEGGQNWAPNLNRIVACTFTGDRVTQKVTGLHMKCADTNYVESCQFEGLNTAVYVEPLTDPVLQHCRFNNFIADRFEACITPFNWATNGAENYVFGRYSILNGPDLGDNLHLVSEWGTLSQLRQLSLTDYPQVDDRPSLQLTSQRAGSGISWFADQAHTNRSLNIATTVAQETVMSAKYGVSINSDNPNARNLQTNMGFISGTLTDANADPGALYYSSDRSKLCYKDPGGTVHEMYV